MRVLALAALDVPYIRDNWSDAIRHVLGADVTQVNVSAWLACAGPEAHMKAVYRLLATGTYDYLFLYHDYIFADFPDEFFAHVRSAGVRTVAYHPDDEPEVWYRRNIPFDARYDIVASHARRGVSRRVEEQRPTQAIYVPWGFNPRLFDRPSGPIPSRHDVLFVGKYKVHENDLSAYREDGRHRDEALTTVARLCDRKGWRFSLFGHGWERHPSLSRYAGGVLSHGEMVRAFHESRIVLNPGWSADEDGAQPQTKLRHFEVPGCGAFQLTNENAELAEMFEPGREVAFYRDNEHLGEQIEYFLEHEPERRAVADAGYTRAHAQHTLDHRVRDLFDMVSRAFPPVRSSQRPRVAPIVRTIHVGSIDELRQLRQQVASSVLDLSGVDAVHLLAANVASVTTEYGALRDWWHADTEVFAGRSFYRSTGRARNPLQPQRTELVGGFLTEVTRLESVPEHHRTTILDRCVSVSDGEHARFLMNYIVRPRTLLRLIDAFAAGNADGLAALSPLETGIVFAEAALDLPAPPLVAADGTALPSYMGHLRRVLRQAAALGQRVAIYGARGDMAESVFAEVRRHTDVVLVGLFDRAMAGRRLAGVPVYSAFDLPQVKPDILLIAAAYSGQAIYEQLKPLEAQITLVPLYDLNAPAWSVLVAA